MHTQTSPPATALPAHHSRPLFGFQEPGYDPTAIDLARATAIAAVVLLGASLVARFATKAAKARW